ncbi:IclR family transcriptional regulator [Nocardia amikacinitolerans]|uniref:IclR family transcriptional regulator n=1 Tax=Nocardia amikacinitolerans TaxID=756689 RepID=UPI0020A5C31C|nr:helix-turn-helix domain-containing protein [Nocardia amikacinitolerans]MCP2275075.1 DNA-binding transcriptional regulator, IclR family [Nocardia amikacinitolerans]MCP2296184.1 DNA-binding transcriptional regulator, IclR family [Nocardia amikacinitolerans]
MSADKSGSARSSPPTDRVVALMERLAALESPATAADLADSLGLSRSTVGAILGSLDGHGWVSRLPDLRYVLGPGFLAMAERARTALEGAAAVPSLLDGLAARVGCGAALSVVGSGQLVFIAVTRGVGHIPAGVEVGLRLPLQAPAGAAVVAFADPAVQRNWIAGGPAERRTEWQRGLRQIADRGFAAWGADVADLHRIDVLGRVIAHLSANASNPQLREEVQALVAEAGGRLHTAAALDADEPLPISYLAAPVFDRGGNALWELQIGPLRPSVSRPERQHYIRELTAAARALGAVMADSSR